MGGYDITSILDFKPPRFICKRCRGLIDGIEVDWESRSARCPVCDAIYIPDEFSADTYPFHRANKYLADEHFAIRFEDIAAHSRRLAELVVASRGAGRREPWPTMRLLLAALAAAESFVHFASYGISQQLLGALKLTSMRVDVCGWASNVQPDTRAEMEEWPTETPRLQAKAINSATWLHAVPHQKLVVIDGLLAFTGSANLTNRGMRQVDRAFDMNEVVTDLAEVRRLNNTYFANVWRTIGAYPEPLVLMDSAPF